MRIYADSASDLPKSFYEENNVTLIPLRVHMNNEEYADVVGVDVLKVYEFIRQGGQPKTSQASPELFLELFEELAKSGEEGLYIAFSSELSGTYSTAVMIYKQVKEQYPDLKLTIVDSKCASLGYGLVVKEAVRLREAGLSLDEISEKVRLNAQHMEHFFTVEDLDYLARGGRVSKASAFIGGLLSIKPLLHVEDGKLIPIEKHRGRKKVMKRILDKMEETGDRLSDQVIAISHGDDLAAAEEMKAMIMDKFQPKAVEIHLIGSAVASHAGPGTLAIFFLNQYPSA
ncbi:DegV family protein [Viridibacillus sp. FSL H8-0123]|uniref:DegV family protein n=1 Tax=Viridibacillus sp. FSL H8-0123 TaxID=1928922 RepID=UPI00096F852E|nr:DegV family protein [Viridibacillus sp. FSL H8-0123]OMC81726.1 fatty acid-binding protein DegV [Viridibacillus sp. FSL H8-0123]